MSNETDEPTSVSSSEDSDSCVQVYRNLIRLAANYAEQGDSCGTGAKIMSLSADAGTRIIQITHVAAGNPQHEQPGITLEEIRMDSRGLPSFVQQAIILPENPALFDKANITSAPFSEPYVLSLIAAIEKSTLADPILFPELLRALIGG